MKPHTTHPFANGVAKPARSRASGSARQQSDHERFRTAMHDGLGQLLTSISFLAGSLQQKLDAQKLPEASEAAEILSLTGRAISEAQALVQEHAPRPRT